MSPDMLPQFLPQCCDAVLYLMQGETCANQNQCYDQLRPIGAQLWFSLPYRFGLPAEILIPVHWFMLFVSIALSVKACLSLAKAPHHNKSLFFYFFISSTCAHLLFFWPVMQHALTDAPASLFALIAIWLLIAEDNQPQAATLALAGLLLGLSAWIRFAYYYPLLGMLAVYLLWWLVNKQRRRMELLLLTALIPVVIQYAATFLHHGTFGFLGPKASAGLSSEHSLSFAAGQETILPQQQYLWPTHCERKIGIEQALKEYDFFTASCLTANRFYFSFGSYAPDTYMFAAVNLLTHSAIEHIGLDNRWQHWHVSGIRRTTEAPETITPDGSQRRFKQKLITFAEPHQQDRIITAEKRLPLGVPYTFSVWLWAPANESLDLILREKGKTELARETVMMTSQPTRFFVTGTPGNPASFFASNYGDIEVMIRLNKPIKEFYAWGAQLEQSPVMTDYQGPDAGVTHTNFRLWSPVILLANMLAMLSVFLLSFLSRKSVTHLRIIAGVFIALIVGEIIVTQPEQRFVIAVEVYIWIYAALLFYRLAMNKLLVVGTQQSIT